MKSIPNEDGSFTIVVPHHKPRVNHMPTREEPSLKVKQKKKVKYPDREIFNALDEDDDLDYYDPYDDSL